MLTDEYYDVNNLFTNVPPSDVIFVFQQYLNVIKCNPLLIIEFIKLMELVLSQNYFCFQNKFYKFDKGLVMGSPISSIAAEVFMDYFEKYYIMNNRNPYYSKLNYWFRYVDDILCNFIGTHEELLEFHRYLNSCHNTIKFTVETEISNCIPFLDLKIHRNENKHTYSIYRKPTTTDICINNRSFCHPHNKATPFIYYIDRLLTIPLNKLDFDNEINYIKHLAIKNGYNTNYIDKIIRNRTRKKLVLTEFKTYKTATPNWTTIPYLGNISHHIGKILSKHNINVAYKNIKSVRDFLVRLKDPVDKMDTSGVYRLSCHECEASYVGITGRKLKTRIREHYHQSTSEFFQHITNEHHDSNNEAHTVELLYKGGNSKKMSAIESINIKLDKIKNENNLNIKSDNFQCLSSNCGLFDKLARMD